MPTAEVEGAPAPPLARSASKSELGGVDSITRRAADWGREADCGRIADCGRARPPTEGHAVPWVEPSRLGPRVVAASSKPTAQPPPPLALAAGARVADGSRAPPLPAPPPSVDVGRRKELIRPSVERIGPPAPSAATAGAAPPLARAAVVIVADGGIGALAVAEAVDDDGAIDASLMRALRVVAARGASFCGATSFRVATSLGLG